MKIENDHAVRNFVIIVACILLLTAVVLSFQSCTDSHPNAPGSWTIKPKDFSEMNLVYDVHTGIVYIQTQAYGGYHLYTPYISENGKYTKYENGEFTEVDGTVEDDDNTANAGVFLPVLQRR